MKLGKVLVIVASVSLAQQTWCRHCSRIVVDTLAVVEELAVEHCAVEDGQVRNSVHVPDTRSLDTALVGLQTPLLNHDRSPSYH